MNNQDIILAMEFCEKCKVICDIVKNNPEQVDEVCKANGVPKTQFLKFISFVKSWKIEIGNVLNISKLYDDIMWTYNAKVPDEFENTLMILFSHLSDIEYKFIMYYYTNTLTYAQIGTIEDISPSTVGVTIKRALEHLRVLYEEYTKYGKLPEPANLKINKDTLIVDCSDLSFRCLNCLGRTKARTLGDVAKMSYYDLFNIKGLGKSVYNELIALFEKHNIEYNCIERK